MMTKQKILGIINGASSLQDALQRIYQFSAHAREEDFFRALLLYFAGKPYCDIYEKHGQKGKVKNLTTGRNSEISDLLILSYCRQWPIIKLNFLQAKKVELNKQTSLGLNVSPAGQVTDFKFQLDAVQYKLLKDCPMIDPMRTGLSRDILFDSCSPAITSYGVFYNSPITGSIEMAYEITHLLTIDSSKGIQSRSKVRTSHFSTVSTMYGGLIWRNSCGVQKPFYNGICHNVLWHDLMSSIDTHSFERAIRGFQIGSPACGLKALAIAKSVIDKYLSNDQEGVDFKEFVQTILNADEQRESRGNGDDKQGTFNDIFNGFGAPKYLLLVNVDERGRRQLIE